MNIEIQKWHVLFANGIFAAIFVKHIKIEIMAQIKWTVMNIRSISKPALHCHEWWMANGYNKNLSNFRLWCRICDEIILYIRLSSHTECICFGHILNFDATMKFNFICVYQFADQTVWNYRFNFGNLITLTKWLCTQTPTQTERARARKQYWSSLIDTGMSAKYHCQQNSNYNRHLICINLWDLEKIATTHLHWNKMQNIWF